VIRTYSLIIEGDGAGYSGYVLELPTILVTGSSIEDLTARAKEAIQLYWETLHTVRSPGSTVREIEVELPVQGGADRATQQLRGMGVTRPGGIALIEGLLGSVLRSGSG
jgi:predicted RNase H-like HicB family nuclease